MAAASSSPGICTDASKETALADPGQDLKPLGRVSCLPDPKFVTVVNTDTKKVSKHQVRGIVSRDGLITEILVYFYAARLAFEWDQQTSSYKLGSNLAVVG